MPYTAQKEVMGLFNNKKSADNQSGGEAAGKKIVKVQNNKYKKKNRIYDILLFVCIAGLLVSGYFLVKDIIPRIENAKLISQIQEVDPSKELTINPDALPSLSVLQEEWSPDIVGWIYIGGTDISLPILQCSNNEYYLNHSYDESVNPAGSIYLDYRADSDFSDQNTVIYGHALYTGGMFSEVRNYRSQSGYEKAPFITIFLDEKIYYYQVFSCNVLEADYNYRQSSYSNFTSYISTMRANSRIDSSASVSSGDKIITLSTCTNTIENGRIAVLAVLLNPDGGKIDLNDYTI